MICSYPSQGHGIHIVMTSLKTKWMIVYTILMGMVKLRQYIIDIVGCRVVRTVEQLEL